MNPSGIRFGVPPMTTRGVTPADVPEVVGFIHSAWTIALEIQAVSGPKLVDWKKVLENDAGVKSKLEALHQKVIDFALRFPLPGYDEL